MATVTPPAPSDHATPGLLVTMSVAVVLLTALIGAFVAIGQWWLLPVTLLVLIAAACYIAFVTARALGDGG